MNKELEKELSKKYSEVRKSLKPLSRNKIINLFLAQLEFALEQQALNIVLVERIKALEASDDQSS